MNSSNGGRRRTLASDRAERFLTELANLRDREAGPRLERRFGELLPPTALPAVAVELSPLRDRQAASAEPGGDLEDPTSRVYCAARTQARMARAFQALKTRKYAPLGARLTSATPSSAEEQLAAVEDHSPDTRAALGPMREIGSAEQQSEWIWRLGQMLRGVWDQPEHRTREWGAFLLLLSVRTAAGSRHGSVWGFDGPLPPPSPFEEVLLHLTRSGDRARHCQNPDCPAPYFFAKRRSQKYCSDGCALPAQREAKRRWWAERGTEWRQQRPAAARAVRGGRRKRGE